MPPGAGPGVAATRYAPTETVAGNTGLASTGSLLHFGCPSEEHDVDEIEAVWKRIEANAGEEFRQLRGGRVEGGSLCPDRTNRNLGKSQFAQALERRPLTSTMQLQDPQGPSYLFAILTDPRITL